MSEMMVTQLMLELNANDVLFMYPELREIHQRVGGTLNVYSDFATKTGGFWVAEIKGSDGHVRYYKCGMPKIGVSPLVLPPMVQF